MMIWTKGIDTAPYSATVLATYFDMDVGEWVVKIFVADRPTAPFTHWMWIASPDELDTLPDDVTELVVAAREFWDINNDFSEESAALDKALEAFVDRVPYENEPEDPTDAGDQS